MYASRPEPSTFSRPEMDLRNAPHSSADGARFNDATTR